MIYKTHMNGGLTAGLLIANIGVENIALLSQYPEFTEPNLLNYGVMFGGCIIGALLADIDSPSSKIGKALKIFSFPLALMAKISRGISIGLKKVKLKWLSKRFYNLSVATSHRGILHEPIIALIFHSLLFLFMLNFFGNPNGLETSLNTTYLIYLIMGLQLGYLSHLFLDFFTVMGLPFFLGKEITYRNFLNVISFGLIKRIGVRTSSKLEMFINFLLTLLNIYLVILFLDLIKLPL